MLPCFANAYTHKTYMSLHTLYTYERSNARAPQQESSTPKNNQKKSPHSPHHTKPQAAGILIENKSKNENHEKQTHKRTDTLQRAFSTFYITQEN